MEEITILKSNNSTVSFNKEVFSELLELFGIDKFYSNLNAEIIFDDIRKDQNFIPENGKVFLLRQLLLTGYFGIKNFIDDEDQKTEKNSELKIRVDKIIPGDGYNYPANVDVFIKEIINNKGYNFNIPSDYTVENLKQLLEHSVLLHKIESTNLHKLLPKLNHVKSKTFIKGSNYLPKNNTLDNLLVIENYFKQNYSIQISDNINAFLKQLYDFGLMDIVPYLLNSDNYSIERYLSDSQYVIYRKIFNKLTKEKYYDKFYRFNYILNIIDQKPDVYQNIISTIKKYNIDNFVSLKNYLPQNEFKKLEKLIEKKASEKSSVNICGHTKLVDEFYKLQTKEEMLKFVNSHEKDLILQDNIYLCKTCGNFVFCQHDIDFKGKHIQDKDLIDKYRDTTIISNNLSVYCKYCGGFIIQDETDEFMNKGNFGEIISAMNNYYNNNDEMYQIKRELYSSVRIILGDFVFDYEFEVSIVIKNIINQIVGYVDGLLKKLKISSTDSYFVTYVRMLGSIYGYFYLYKVYLGDKKVNLKEFNKNEAKIDINKFANYFSKKIYVQFKSIINDEARLKNIISDAYLKMKTKISHDVDRITEYDIVNIIISNYLYEFLYKLLKFERIAENSSNIPNTVEAFHTIVKVNNPNELNFWLNSYKPTKSPIWKDDGYKIYRDLWEYLFDFSSPKNYLNMELQNLAVPDFEGYVKNKFDPSIMESLTKLGLEAKNEFWMQKVMNYHNYNRVNGTYGIVPANYFYIDGKFINWEYEIESTDKIGKKKLIGLKHDKLKFDSIKPDYNFTPSAIKFADKGHNYKRKTTKNNEVTKDIKFNINYSVLSKIVPKLNVNQIKFLGRSEGVLFKEFIKGNIIDNFTASIVRLHGYINKMIINYNILRFSINDKRNLVYFQEAKKVDQIEKYYGFEFPEINEDLFKEIKIELSEYCYNLQQKYFISMVEKIFVVNDPILNTFLINNLTNITNTDKLYCISNYTNAGDFGVADQDNEPDGEIDVNKNDDDFINENYIDYEQDDDEINADD